MGKKDRPQYGPGIDLTNRLVSIDTQTGVTYIGLSKTASENTTLHNYIVTPTNLLVTAVGGYRIAAIYKWREKEGQRGEGEEDVKIQMPLAVHNLLPPTEWLKKHCLA